MQRKKIFLPICLTACLILNMANLPLLARSYTSGKEILIGRTQALSNEQLDIVLTHVQGDTFETINFLKEENKYLKQRINWLENYIDKIDK